MQTYSTDPVADAGRYFDAMYADQEERSRTIESLEREFITDALKRDLHSDTSLNETTVDFTQPVSIRRTSKVSEVLFESLDWPNGPNVDQLIALVVSKAKTGDVEAIAFVSRMATAYATHAAR